MKSAKKKNLVKKEEVNGNEELESIKVQLTRALADYDNLRKRVEAEKEIWFKVASARVINKFLSVLDNLENAQKHLNDQGLAIVLNEFRRTVTEEGFEEIQIKPGETQFDSETMEAVEVVENKEEGSDGKVAELVLSGWQGKPTGNERQMVVRPARVKVYKS